MVACILSLYIMYLPLVKANKFIFYIIAPDTIPSTLYSMIHFFFIISREYAEIKIIEMILSLCIKSYATVLRYSMYQ